MAENRIHYSAEAESKGFDKLKRDLNEARDGVLDMNAVIGQGSSVQAELGEQTNQAARMSGDTI